MAVGFWNFGWKAVKPHPRSRPTIDNAKESVAAVVKVKRNQIQIMLRKTDKINRDICTAWV